MPTDHPHHTSVVVERTLPGNPKHAFRFWSEADLKARWTDCHTDWTVLDDRFDFRVGGVEAKRWRTPDGTALTFNAYYLDIVPQERIIYAYEMTLGGTRLSASLVTVTFEPEGGKTRLCFTEQAALLAGGDEAREQRLTGTGEALDRLAEFVERKGLVRP